MQIGVFHPGTQHSWQTALALQQLDRLAWYATSIFYKPAEWPYRIERYIPGRAGAALSREFQRFSMPALDVSRVQTAGMHEWLERIARRLGRHELARSLDVLGNRRFVSQIAGHIRGATDLALWGYNGSSLTSFELAKESGLPCILDRTIGDGRAYNAAMQHLQDAFGEWFLPVEREASQEAIEISESEYALADHILVGCEYAKRTLEEHSTSPGTPAKIRVLDYCFDEALFSNLPPPEPKNRAEPVRFLFLGLVIPRKGIHHVLEALDQIPPGEAELTIVGDLKIPRSVFARYADRVRYIPTVPRAEVPRIMSEHDVLLLPTYHEGAGIVLYEALAAGMGLIQSDRAALCATDDTGITLDRLDTQTLLEAMRVPIEDREKLDHWRACAQSEAQRYTFSRYREGSASFLSEAGL